MAKSKKNQPKEPSITSQGVKVKAEEIKLTPTYKSHSKYRAEPTLLKVNPKQQKALKEDTRPTGLHLLKRDRKFTS